MNTTLMDHDAPDQGVVDRVMIGWAFAWSFALSLVVAGILNGRSVDSLSDEGTVTLGVAIGGLSAVWTLIGTWIALIDLPVFPVDQGNQDPTKQRLRPRLLVLGYWLANILILSLCVYEQANALAQILLTVATAMMASVVAMQWTDQRIHRGAMSRQMKRSIRQILGITTTIALMIALLKAGDELLDLSGSLTAMVVSSAILWLVMLVTTLGRRWWICLVTIPVVIGQWVVVSTLMDLQSRTTETLIMRLSGGILGFYFFSLMFLMLMRSSGHRWIGSQIFSTRESVKR